MTQQAILSRQELTDASDALIELSQVTRDFGGLRAVDHVDLTIRRGELRGLIGPNGAGKSTVFKLIMGIHSLTSGKILFNGTDISEMPTWQRARLGIGIKMQIPCVYGELTGYENMRIAAQNYMKNNEIKGEIERIVELIGIEHLLLQEVNNLSHGQQQWLEIAMTLLSNPDLLLLDEPVAGMGPEETAFTAEIIKRLNENGFSIIFIDHDMEFVRQISKKVTVLHQGATFAEGNINEIESNKEVIEIYLGSDSSEGT
ncbi:ATP-binding cassette domain-containing protein [Sporosarcina cascadiensis]|uniref:ATP-binding cassette domain-containing protein n=1 Tax=Sporosarcina cascadiensis TaxID=2660747 RepID=UPI001E3D4672|nr:ATP-binding cassette domain-containing protein [Sporosarcina cascadiensis]